MAKPKHRGWKLLVIPEDESGVRQFQIPRKAVILLVSAVALLIVYSLVETVLFWTVARRAAQVEPLKRKVREMEGSSKELARLGGELSRLKSFESQLRKVLSGRQGVSMDALPFGGPDQFPGAENSSTTPVKSSTSPVGDSRSLGGMGYTAMDLPTMPPVRGYVTRQFLKSSPEHVTAHAGMDIAAREGTPVLAAASGLVVFADWTYRYGNLVVVSHRSGYVSLYGHNQVLFVRLGDKIRQGDPIAMLGNSGISSAPHLHFEVWQDGNPVDPMTLLAVSP